MKPAALVIAVLTATGVVGCVAPPTAAAQLAVSAPVPPLSVPGSDGLRHVEYDLVVTNPAAPPATLTLVEVRTADDRLLLRLDGPALVASTQPLDGTSPTAEIPGSSAVAVVVDLGLAPDRPAAGVTHRIGY